MPVEPTDKEKYIDGDGVKWNVLPPYHQKEPVKNTTPSGMVLLLIGGYELFNWNNGEWLSSEEASAFTYNSRDLERGTPFSSLDQQRSGAL